MTRLEIRIRLVLSSVLLVVAVAYVLEASSFRDLAKYAPLTAGSMAVVLLALVVVRETLRLRRYREESAGEYGRTIEYMEEEGGGVSVPSLLVALRYLAWLVGFVFVIWAAGLFIAAPVFLTLFLVLDAKTSARFTVISILALLVALWLLGEFGFEWPTGALVTI